MAKEKIITTDNKREILWNVVNASILGAAVFFGSFIDGGVSRTDLIASFGAAALLFLSKFGDYWKSEKTEYMNKNSIKNHFGVFL